MKADKIEDFLNDFYNNKENDKNKRITCKKILSYYQKTKKHISNILEYNETQYKELLRYFAPSSLVELSNLIYRISDVLKAYCKIYNIEWDNSTLVKIDKDELWFSFKQENDLKRYFDEKTYNNIIKQLDKDVLYDGNDLYYKTLFMAIYEGIYNKNLTEIKNLRVSDIDTKTNIVTLNDDAGNQRELKISPELINNLIKLSKVNTWYKIQGRSTELVGAYIGGEYEDSVFKILSYNNKDKAKSYKEFYYRRLKVLCKEFLGYQTSPLQIYISGIMNRVYKELSNINIESKDLKKDDNSYTSTMKFFIGRECKRVNYNVNLSSFMRILKSYADVFDNNIDT